MAEIVERIPHNTVSYAYLEIRAGSANEFESLREEALKKIPHYAFASASPAEPKNVESVEQEQAVEPVVTPAAAPAASPADSTLTVGEPPQEARERAQAIERAEESGALDAPAPTSTEGLSPREIARARLAQKGA